MPTKAIDHAEIAKRFQEFTDVFKAKPYQRQKSALEQQLLDFLATLSPPKDVSSCTSDDIVKFLISKDKSGKTVLHSRLYKILTAYSLPHRIRLSYGKSSLLPSPLRPKRSKLPTPQRIAATKDKSGASLFISSHYSDAS